MAGTRMRKMATGLTTKQKKAVTAIAKKTTLKIAETKSAINSAVTTLAGDTVYARNLNFFIPQGSTSESIEGEKFHLKNIYIKGVVINSNNATSTLEDLIVRVMLIRTKKALTNTGASITTTDVFRGTTSRNASLGFVDLHKVDLLFDKTFKVGQPEQTNTDNQICFTINKKINKTLFVDTDNGGYLKDKNYYLIYTAHKANNTFQSVATIRYQWAINFKDV